MMPAVLIVASCSLENPISPEYISSLCSPRIGAARLIGKGAPSIRYGVLGYFNLPTTGPVLLRALMYQDMYLAGSFVMMLSVLTITGTLLSDIMLAFLDPRIRYGGMSA